MSAVRLTFWGAAGQVTGSMHMLEAAGGRFLLDAGSVPGPPGRHAGAERASAVRPPAGRRRRPESRPHRPLGPAPAPGARGVSRPDLRHAVHPRPLRGDAARRGADPGEGPRVPPRGRARRGPESEPLYTLADALAVQDLMVGVPYRRVFHLRKHLALEFLDAGHILGSAVGRSADHRGRTTGASCSPATSARSGLPIVRDPEPPTGPIDTLIIEATYADRSHESVGDAETRLGEAIRRVAARGGKVLIPAFAAGPVPGGDLQPPSPLSRREDPRAADLRGQPARRWTSPRCSGCTRRSSIEREQLIASGAELFDFPLVSYVRDVEQSKALNGLHGPAVIIAASGMAESGRILHHLAHGIGDHRNLVLFVGFQAEHTLGRRIQEGEEVVRILGQEYRRQAEVESHRRVLGPRRPERAARLGPPAGRAGPARLRGARRGVRPRARWRRSSARKRVSARSTSRRTGSRSTSSGCATSVRPSHFLLLAGAIVYTVGLVTVLVVSQQDQRRPVDAIVVLGAAQYNGRPSPVLRARLDHALGLYREGLAPADRGDRRRRTRATPPARPSWAGAISWRHDVPARAVVAQPEGRTTMASMTAVAAWLRSRGHQPRAPGERSLPYVSPPARGPAHPASRPTPRPPRAVPSPTTPCSSCAISSARGSRCRSRG